MKDSEYLHRRTLRRGPADARYAGEAYLYSIDDAWKIRTDERSRRRPERTDLIFDSRQICASCVTVPLST